MGCLAQFVATAHPGRGGWGNPHSPISGGAWRDNVFVERLWRSVKYEEVYLKAHDSVAEARASIGRYLEFHNRKRPRSSLNAKTPDHACFNHPPLAVAA